MKPSSGPLVAHPWDALGSPPPLGGSYVVEPGAKATASFRGFTDAKGRTLTWEQGCEEAARVVMNQHEREFVEVLISENCAPEDVLEWLVDPETGEFGE